VPQQPPAAPRRPVPAQNQAAARPAARSAAAHPVVPGHGSPNLPAEADLDPSVGSVEDSYDNALAETIIGLFKTQLIQHQGPWRHAEQLELATLRWVGWHNNARSLEPLGYVPPAEFEQEYYRRQEALATGAGVRQTNLRRTRGDSLCAFAQQSVLPPPFSHLL
jgi:transposase InsO family protein